MANSLETLLDELDQQPTLPAQTALYYFSELDSQDISLVHAAWPRLPVQLRRDVITHLVQIAEADFEVDFGVVFRLSLADPDAKVRTAAIEGLWEDEDENLIPILSALLHQDEAISVRAAAAKSLGRFILLGELGKIRSEAFHVAYQATLTACQDPSEHLEVQRRALESLAYTDSETVMQLIHRAYDASEEKMRVSSVFAMGRSADARWSRCVCQELFSPNPEMRYEAARACGELELTESVPDLEELCDDVDPEVQESALWALGQIGGDRARQILERYCQADNEALHAAAEAALDELEFLHGDLSDFFARLARMDD
ncbi:MAG TPA: HEAT repeat domain-containing protein [Chloroflexi bacterium]|nr:HEAT repeat domain-containing protein [Chloroflexota bacterium]